MKNTLLPIALFFAGQQLASAQIVHDTVNTFPTYTNNVWYSLENDNQASEAANTWHIALATEMSPQGLVTAALFNHKIGKVYEIPGSNPANFATADTTGLSMWTPLQNSETTWKRGAFNNTTDLGTSDYGWGNYNGQTHGVDANRIFVIKLHSGEYRKLTISSNNMGGTYTLVHDNLNNTDLTTETITVASYATKNFLYYNTLTKTIIDREPTADSWDLYFTQFLTEDVPSPHNFVTGIFQNVGVEVAKVHPVNSDTYTDYSSATFETDMNVIGWNWKTLVSMTYAIEDSTVFFIDDVDGDIWKVVMTGFTGTSQGKYAFTKERIAFLGVDENNAEIFSAVYPNPSNDVATIVLKNAPAATINVYDLLGTLVYTQTVDATDFTAVPLHTEAFANGTYQVMCLTGKTVSMQQLIVQH